MKMGSDTVLGEIELYLHLMLVITSRKFLKIKEMVLSMVGFLCQAEITTRDTPSQ